MNCLNRLIFVIKIAKAKAGIRLVVNGKAALATGFKIKP